MSIHVGLYTLYYSIPSQASGDEIGRQEDFENIVDALTRAIQVFENPGKATHLIYDNAVLFAGDELDALLRKVSDNRSQPGNLANAITNILPDALIKQLASTVKISHEHFGAVVVYRSMLEELYKAADQAIQKKDLELLYRITGKLAFWYVPSEEDVKQWGKDFLHAYRRDGRWLHHTKKALEKIKVAAAELEVIAGSRSAELKKQIIQTAEEGLITHV